MKDPMRQSVFKTLLVACSVLSGCAHAGPKVAVCISDPEANVFQCVDREGKSYVLPFRQTGNYVCMPPEDAQNYMQWCNRAKQNNILEESP